jgi:hypothetical protein
MTLPTKSTKAMILTANPKAEMGSIADKIQSKTSRLELTLWLETQRLIPENEA